jgi:hypothetical protein
MKKKEIYEHLADIYLSTSKKKKAKSASPGNAALRIGIMNVEHELWALNGVPDKSGAPGDDNDGILKRPHRRLSLAWSDPHRIVPRFMVFDI